MRFEKGNKSGRKFQPGKSGNPGGRPRVKLLSQAYKEALGKLDPRSRQETSRLIATALVRKARKGDVKAAIELADRTEGKAQQHVEVESNSSVLFMSDRELDQRIDELLRKWKAEKSHGGAKHAG